MATTKTNNKVARMLAILVLTFVFAALLGPAPGATARVVRGSTSQLATTLSEPTTPSATPGPSDQTGKLGVYLTHWGGNSPAEDWLVCVSGAVSICGRTNSLGYYAVLLPPGEYYVEDAEDYVCPGGHVDPWNTTVNIVANQPTTVQGEAGRCWVWP